MMHDGPWQLHATPGFYARTDALISHALASSVSHIGGALRALNGPPPCVLPTDAAYPTSRLWILRAR